MPKLAAPSNLKTISAIEIGGVIIRNTAKFTIAAARDTEEPTRQVVICHEGFLVIQSRQPHKTTKLGSATIAKLPSGLIKTIQILPFGSISWTDIRDFTKVGLCQEPSKD